MSAGLFTLAEQSHTDTTGIVWEIGAAHEVDPLLRRHHYLGPIGGGGADLIVIGSRDGEVCAAQVWRAPTSRHLPPDGTWLELSRWCLTPAAGGNAGSRQHRYAVRLIRAHLPAVRTLVSYSDPGHGHGGALYRACNWTWAPTWLRLRPPPGGHGAWQAGNPQGVKDRWVYAVGRDPRRDDVLDIGDPSAIRHWLRTAPDHERRWARSHPQLAAAIRGEATA